MAHKFPQLMNILAMTLPYLQSTACSAAIPNEYINLLMTHPHFKQTVITVC